MASVRSRILRGLVRWSAARSARLDLPALREKFERDASKFGTCAPGTVVSQTRLPNCRAETLRVGERPGNRHLLYLHGGGFVFGSARSHRGFVTQLCARAGCEALVPDYRLAPEHPFPAALEDARSAYAYLLDTGVQPSEIVVAGDSSGAGLAVGLLLTLRAQDQPQPAGCALVSPWLDLGLSGPSVTANAKRDPMLRRESLREWAHLYLGDTPTNDPLASPFHAEPRGLAPMLALVSSDELLLSETVDFAQRARAAGTPADLRVVDDMLHVWPLFYGALPEARAAIDEIGAHLDAALGSRIQVAADK